MLKATVRCVAPGLRLAAGLLVITGSLLAGCAPLSHDEARLTQRHWRDAADWDSAMAREEADFLRQPEARARRDAAGLHLRLANDGWVTLAEDRDCRRQDAARDVLRDCLRKHAIGRFAGRGYWLLAVTLQEGQAYALVNERDGRETLLIGPPYFSPDGRHLAAVNSSLRGDTVNGVEVWRLEADAPVLVFFHEEKGGSGYDFTEWTSPDTARLTYRGCIDQFDLACQTSRERGPREAVLTGRGGKWRLAPWTR